jgi:molecular chaperone GrpE
MNKFEQKWLEEIFPLEVDEQQAEPDSDIAVVDDKDVLSVLSELLKEKSEVQQLAVKLKYTRDSANSEELEQLMKSILPFLDGLEHVLKIARAHPPSEEVDNWLKTIETLYFRVTNILEKYGLKAIESVGKPVDLDFHEVVEYIPSKESLNNTVIAERQKGYIFKNRVLRDAKVVVAYQEGSV